MKKFLALLLLPVCLMICACTQSGDNSVIPDTYTGTELSEEKELEIRQAYFNANYYETLQLEDVEITRFYGAFNGAYVMYIDAKLIHTTMLEYDRIEDTVFCYGSSHKISVYHGGRFYGLPQAFEAGLLTLEDVHTVSERCRAIYANSSFILPRLSEEKELEIRQAYFTKFKSDSHDKLEHVQIKSFWGAYNGCYVVYFGCGIADAIDIIAVEDVVFTFPNTKALAYVYKDGEFYSFNEAYEAEFMTLDDFHAVYSFYKTTAL